MRDRLFLDHASLRVRDYEEALDRLERRLGLVCTRNAEAPDTHSRLFLDRSYMDVNARWGKVPMTASGWAMPFFLLRHLGLQEVLEHLRAAGLESRQSEHVAADGRWLDVWVLAPEGVQAPLLVRRTHPPELAADWPPPLPRPQPCGAYALEAVHVRVARMEPAVDFYRRLLGVESLPPAAPDGYFGGERVEATLASGRIVLHAGEGALGIMGAVFAVPSVAEVEGWLGRRGVRSQRGAAELWVDPAETGEVMFGFRER